MQVQCASAQRSADSPDSSGSDAASRHDTDAGPTLLLRRPFSIAGQRSSGASCEIDLFGRVIGVGSAWLAARSPGDVVDVIGPLGRGFSRPAAGRRAVLVAGGIGLPPVRWLGEILRRAGISCDAIYGALTRTHVPLNLVEEPDPEGALTLCAEEFARDGIKAAITTDDGTCGLRGSVTDGMLRYFDDHQDLATLEVYACGPEPMLRGVASLCASRGVDCELALERMMGCGIGTCQSCVVGVVDASSTKGWRYALCCTDGPVFNAAEIIWS